MTELERLRDVWRKLGQDDPLWAVLSHADKRGRRWNADEFLATGRVEIGAQVAWLAQFGLPHASTLALDFGCGAGRLTRALAEHFEHVVGIDVSATMIDAARWLNADVGRAEFRVNESPRIEGIADRSVDLVFSHITLQHIPTALALGYVDEFFRVLAPGGVAMFQFVDGADDSLRGRIFGLASNRWLNPLRRVAWRRRDVFEMHALPERLLAERLDANPHLRLVEARDDGSAGAGWRGRRWTVVSDEAAPCRVSRDGYVLYADPLDRHIGAPLIAGRPHEPHVERALREHLHPGNVVLDIGANIGCFALLAASRVGPAGRVVAIEPLARNCVLLARAAQENGFGQVEVIAAAAAEAAGEQVLRTHPDSSNGVVPDAAGELLREARGRFERVPSLALDTLFEGAERLDLVKIDIAGMEPPALRGLGRTLERLRPVLVSEFHPWAIERAAGERPIDYLQWLRRLYPAVTVLHRDGRRSRLSAAEEVMRAWREANAAAGLGDRLQLDLLLEP